MPGLDPGIPRATPSGEKPADCRVKPGTGVASYPGGPLRLRSTRVCAPMSTKLVPKYESAKLRFGKEIGE
jgi:hypothetical protein